MNVSLQRSYRSKNGNPTFVYKVTGNAADLESFKDAQGEFYRTDDNGHPLWFTTRCIGPSGKLIITTNGNIVPDMSAFDQAASIAAQYGGNFGQELARMSAAQILGSNAPQADASAPATPAASSSDEEVTEDAQVDDADDSIE
jgi:hypothetical protein